MRIEPDDLELAVGQGVITREQARALEDIAQRRAADRPGLTLQHLAYYLGGLMVIGALGWYVTTAWESLGGPGFMLVAALYAAGFLGLARVLRGGPATRVPVGLLVTLAVCMTPFFVYGLELTLDIWPQAPHGGYPKFFHRVRGCWLFMELATIGVGVFAVRRVRFPFLVMPVAVALLFLSMDVTAVLFGQDEMTWPQRRWVSLCFGLGMLAVGYAVDRLTRDDYAFWLYLAGLLAFWGALTSMNPSGELSRLLYCAVNVVLLLVGVLLERRTFLVFGGVGVALYLGHLAYQVFRDSLAFPFVLSGIGLGVMALGWAYQRNGAALNAAVVRNLPAWLARGLPRNRQTPGI